MQMLDGGLSRAFPYFYIFLGLDTSARENDGFLQSTVEDYEKVLNTREDYEEVEK